MTTLRDVALDILVSVVDTLHVSKSQEPASQRLAERPAPMFAIVHLGLAMMAGLLLASVASSPLVYVSTVLGSL